MTTGYFHYFESNIPVTCRACAVSELSGLRVLIKIPAVSIDVPKNHNHSVLFLPHLLEKVYAFCLDDVVVPSEVVGLQEQKYRPPI